MLSKSDVLIIRYENGENEVVEDKVSKQEENSQNSVSKNIVAGMSYREYKKLYDTQFRRQEELENELREDARESYIPRGPRGPIGGGFPMGEGLGF